MDLLLRCSHLTGLPQAPGNDEVLQLQKTLLDYLDDHIETDPSLVVSFSFSYSQLCIYDLICVFVLCYSHFPDGLTSDCYSSVD